MMYRIGDIVRGKVNGREFKIVERTDYHYTYQDIQSGRNYMVGRKMFEQCELEKVSKEKE